MTSVDFLPVPLPSTDEIAGVADGIATWIGSAAMAAVLAEFGQEPVRPGPLADQLAYLADFSARRWDYRKGKERYLTVGEEFAPEMDARLRTAIGALGLVGQRAVPARKYDHVLVLGGGVRTMMARANLTASLLRDGLITQTIAGLGGVRKLEGQEDLAAQYGLPPCPTEGEGVDQAMRHVLQLSSPSRQRSGVNGFGQPWWQRSYLDARPIVHVLAAASTRPGLRANTGDTLIGWADLVVPDPKGARLLVLTTDSYVPFQHCDAIRLLALPHGCSIDTVGLDSENNAWLPPMPTFALLQEVRSAILSMQNLCLALAS